jgi:cytochrome b561
LVKGFSRTQIALHRPVAVLTALQVMAAFYHHFVRKNGLLYRMRKPG